MKILKICKKCLIEQTSKHMEKATYTLLEWKSLSEPKKKSGYLSIELAGPAPSIVDRN